MSAAPDIQLAELRVHPATPVPPASKPSWLIAMEEADRARDQRTAQLLLSLQSSNAAGVSAVLDSWTPAERLGVLHALVSQLRDAQEWSHAPTSEGLLAAAVHLHLNT